MMCAAAIKDGAGLEEKADTGIVNQHAYGVIAAKTITYDGETRVIVQMRNPWGSFEWKGDFSDNWDGWTPELKKQVNFVNADDGCFWMPYEDF